MVKLRVWGRLMRGAVSGGMVTASLAVGSLMFPISTKAQSDITCESPVHQLRVYEIFEGNKAAFHARFRDHAARIMRRYDFQIVAMWEAQAPERTEFVYLLEWDDETMLETQWAKFMADKEWADIKQRSAAEHGQLVGKIENRLMRLTAYSQPSNEISSALASAKC